MESSSKVLENRIGSFKRASKERANRPFRLGYSFYYWQFRFLFIITSEKRIRIIAKTENASRICSLRRHYFVYQKFLHIRRGSADIMGNIKSTYLEEALHGILICFHRMKYSLIFSTIVEREWCDYYYIMLYSYIKQLLRKGSTGGWNNIWD